MKFKVQFQGQDAFFVTPGPAPGSMLPPQVTLGPVRERSGPVTYIKAFGVEFQVYGSEIPSITQVEPEIVRYIVTTEVWDVASTDGALRTETIRKPAPAPGDTRMEVPLGVHHKASLIVAINERTGETRVLKNRWGQNGKVTP